MKFFDLKFNQLMAYGIHIGHTLYNNIILSGWMIGALRQSVSVIKSENLFMFLNYRLF